MLSSLTRSFACRIALPGFSTSLRPARYVRCHWCGSDNRKIEPHGAFERTVASQLNKARRLARF